MWNSLEVIERRLKMKHGDGSWRMNEQQFSPQVGCKFRPGTLSMAPAWFQQGMQVRLVMIMRKQTVMSCVDKIGPRSISGAENRRRSVLDRDNAREFGSRRRRHVGDSSGAV